MNDVILVYITCKDIHDADKITDHLFTQRLIASVNYQEMHSRYMRQGKIQQGDEIIAIYKTIDSLRPKVEQEILSIHTYHKPCILKIETTATKAYSDWIMSCVA